MKDLLQACHDALNLMESYLVIRLGLTNPKPRVLRLCDRMGLHKPEEIRALLFVVLINAGVDLPTTAIRPTCSFMVCRGHGIACNALCACNISPDFMTTKHCKARTIMKTCDTGAQGCVSWAP